MNAKYDPKKIEPKWQKYWEAKKTYRQYNRAKKFYALDMFPYPSGAGLHVGHPKGYIATDIVARKKQLEGYGVLHPMGWDAFGLPAERFAIKSKTHPKVSVRKNIANFKKQLAHLGFTYDWDREISTTDPEYYRWTQWIFLQLFKKGLVYESEEPINWCPTCQTGLANEDLEDGKCEVCGSDIEKKPLRQWVIRMTAYADRLLRDLDTEKLDWSESIKEQQRNWIGRSEGTTIKFKIQNEKLKIENQMSEVGSRKSKVDEYIEVFTTRVDTIFGCTYVVVAPEHPFISELLDCYSREGGNPDSADVLDPRVKPEDDGSFEVANAEEVRGYIESVKKKTEQERNDATKEKTGVKLEGIEAVNPFTGEMVPIFVADYVLGNYGTGAVMAVPAHDERDFAFAKKYNVPICSVIAPYIRLTGVCTPREDRETISRECVTVILWDKEKKKVLLLKRKKDGVHVFPGGGIEKGEQSVETAIREITEETGYTDFTILRVVIPKLYGHGYKMRKDVNCSDPEVVFEGQLISNGRLDLTEEEHQIHDVLWVDADKVGDLPNFLDSHEYEWKILHSDKHAFCDDGITFDSGEFTGLKSEEAREKMTAWLEEKGFGRKQVNYKLRDWVFSRQRYWGEPIPLVKCDLCGWVPVPEKDLPVTLPSVKSYEPSGTGESPLANIEKWVSTKCPTCGGVARRETNTMPQWAGSSWYYLRYIDPTNSRKLVDLKKEKEWMPVDLYVGGAEHATRHLLYARFWHKFLYDIGVVSTREPFKRLVHVGLIMASDGRKMSKRWGNVVNPDDMVRRFGADALRLYEMFLGPFSQSASWNTDGMVGMRRFLEKVWKIKLKIHTKEKKLSVLLHKTIKKVSEDIEEMRFNTAISALMILANEMERAEFVAREDFETFLILLAPFAPHIAEELWSLLGNKTSIMLERWPKANPKFLTEETTEVIVQVNGKLRARLRVSVGASEEEVERRAREEEVIKKYLDNSVIRKVIFVPDRLVNFVV